MNLLDKAVRLERALLDRLARRRDIARHPLEIYHAVLDDIEDATEPGPRGGRIFPYERIVVTVVAPDAHSRSTAQALALGPPSLEERVRARLRHAGCTDVDGVTVTTKFVEQPLAEWPDQQYCVELRPRAAERRPRPAPSASHPIEVQLTILSGTTGKPRYSFTAPRINLGRLADVVDRHNRIARQNHVAFGDDRNDVNQSVSRTHAHITIGGPAREARLHDDGSTHGTRVVRGGHTIPVPRGGRGVALRDGDEVLLGHARLRVSLRSATGPTRPARRRRPTD